MNTTIRKIVSQTKVLIFNCSILNNFLHQFEGTGSLSTSMGTSHSEAMANQALRQEITAHPEVAAFFDTFIMEDKTGLVVLDR